MPQTTFIVLVFSLPNMMGHSPIGAKELEARKPLWLALSDLFLDTQVEHYDCIALACANSPYSLDELYKILVEEVAPVLYLNLISVAGVWDGFDEEWLVEEILRHKQSASHPSLTAFRFFLRQWFSNRICKKTIDDCWSILRPMIMRHRETSPN